MAKRRRRTSSSSFVFLARTDDIILLLVCLLTMSVMIFRASWRYRRRIEHRHGDPSTRILRAMALTVLPCGPAGGFFSGWHFAFGQNERGQPTTIDHQGGRLVCQYHPMDSATCQLPPIALVAPAVWLRGLASNPLCLFGLVFPFLAPFSVVRPHSADTP